jgi:ABC-type transport system substrate-binding protein
MKTTASLPILLFLLLLTAISACKREPAVEYKRTDNTVIVGMPADADRLNPLLATTAYARTAYEQIFSYLVTQDPVTGEFLPQLAKSLPERKETADGLVAYTFEIREEAKWDDGSPVTAGDFVFTLKAILNPKVAAQRIRPYVSFIKKVEIDGANPRRFTVFSEKYILAEEAISSAFPVMQESHYDPDGLLKSIAIDQFLQPEVIAALAESDERLGKFAEVFASEKFSREKGGVTGSGPYRLETWETGQRIVLVKKENWWGDKLGKSNPPLEAFPDQITYKILSDAVTTLNALKAEEIDAVFNIDPKDFVELKNVASVSDRYEFASPPTLSNFFIYVNATNPILSDKLVRKALSHAVNAPEIIDNVFYGLGQPVHGPAHPSTDYYHRGLKPVDFNIEKAKSLLAQAGWTDSDNNGYVDKDINGVRTELKIKYLMNAARETSKNLALLLQDNAKKAGIQIELVAKDPLQIIDDIKKKNYEIAGGGRSATNTLWDPMQSWHTAGDNRTGFGTPETDALIEEIQVTLDEKARNEKYKKLQEIIYDEQVEIYLFVPQDRVLIHKRFDAEAHSVFPGFSVNRFRLKK